MAKALIVHDGSVAVRVEGFLAKFMDDQVDGKRRYRANFDGRRLAFSPDPRKWGKTPPPSTFESIEVQIGQKGVGGVTGSLTLHNERGWLLRRLRLEQPEWLRFDRSQGKFVDQNDSRDLEIRNVVVKYRNEAGELATWECPKADANNEAFAITLST